MLKNTLKCRFISMYDKIHYKLKKIYQKQKKINKNKMLFHSGLKKNTLKCSKGKWGQSDNTKWKGGFIASKEFIYLLQRLDSS